METAELSARKIQNTVAQTFHIDLEQLLSRRRQRKFSYPRMLAMYLVREITGKSYPWVAVQFGNVHHTSIIHACKWVRDKEEYREYIIEMLKRLHYHAMERKNIS